MIRYHVETAATFAEYETEGEARREYEGCPGPATLAHVRTVERGGEIRVVRRVLQRKGSSMTCEAYGRAETDRNLCLQGRGNYGE